jgi:hypothetical protein
MSSRRLVTLEVRCCGCAETLNLEFSDEVSKGPIEEAAWHCPACGALNKVGALGRVVTVTPKRHPRE